MAIFTDVYICMRLLMMKAYILFLLLCLSFAIATAQSREIDSLQNLLKAAPNDTTKILLLNSLSIQISRSGKYDSAIAMAEKAEKAAEKLAYKKGIANTLMTISIAQYRLGNYNSALEYAFRALAVFQDMKSKRGIAYASTGIGDAYTQLCKYSKSLEYDMKSLAIYQELGEKQRIMYNLRSISINYNYLGNYSDALSYALKALPICLELNNKKILSNLLSDIGSVYYRKRDYENALKYYNRSLKISDSTGEKILSAYSLNSIGNIHEDNERNYDAALESYSKALVLFKEVKYSIGVTFSLIDIGRIYRVQGNYSEALENESEALDMARKINYPTLIAKSHMELGFLDMQSKSYKQAKVHFDSALVISKNIGVKDVTKDAYRGLFQLDSTMRDYKTALENYKQYIVYKDSIDNDANEKKIVQAEMNYEFEQKQAAEKLEQNKKDAIRDAEETRQKAKNKIALGLIASFSIILALLVIVIFQRMKGAEKKKLLAEQQKSWLELKALRTQMNPHFLYNTINSIQSFILKNDTKSSANYLNQFARLMRGVLENSRKDKITLAEEMEGLYNYLDFETMRFSDKFNYQIVVDEKLDKAKTLLPPLLIQPYIENAIWHGLMPLSSGGGQVNIIFEKVNNHIKCTVDDNGIGRKAAKEIKNDSMHKSLGMSIVAQRMESMNKMYQWDMKVDITDKQNDYGISTGTKVEIYLPLILNTVLYD